MTARGTRILGLGHALPERRVTSAELEARFALEAGWIERRTGIRERRWAGESDTLSGLAIEAGAMALAKSGLAPEEVGLLILATSTPDQLLPPTAPLVAHRLGLSAGAIDLAGACAGFVYALAFAEAQVRATGKPALVVAGNILSRRINMAERASAILFADAVGAVLLGPSDDPARGVVSRAFASKGAGYGLVGIPAGGGVKPFSSDIPIEQTLMTIVDGRGLFVEAVEMIAVCSIRALGEAGLLASDVDRFVPHQANARIFSAVGRKVGLSEEATVSTIAEFGNSSAGTVPLSLSLSAMEKPFEGGEILLLAAAGAGLTAGAVVFRA